MRKRLSDEAIEKLEVPTKRVEISDATVRGLVLRLSPNGTRSWSVIAHRTRTGLGRWPTLGCEAARKRALEVIQTPHRRVTLRDAATQYLAHQEQRGITNARNFEALWRLHIDPVLGNRAIASVRRADLHSLLDSLPKLGVRREVRRFMVSMFRYAQDREMVASSPAEAMKRPDIKSNLHAGRALSDAELKLVWDAAERMGYPFGRLIQLLLLTGQRRGDWANATWAEVDLNAKLLTIPAHRFKGRREHTVPLSEPVLAILRDLPRDGTWLFSTTHGRAPVLGFERAAQKLRALLGDEVAPFRTYHDLRVTARSLMSAIGIGSEIAEDVIGHAQPALVRRYSKHDGLETKRRALEQLAAHVLEVTAPR